MSEDATYQTLVYREQGGDAEVVKSGGIIRGHSGGIMSVESGFNFFLASQAVLTKDLLRYAYSAYVPYEIVPSFGISVLAESNIPKNVRVVNIYGSVAASKMSIWLTSCSAGAELFLRLCGDSTGTFTNANTSLAVITSGCILLGSLGGRIASFTMHTSAASDCGVHLIAPRNNVWAIVNEFMGADGITES